MTPRRKRKSTGRPRGRPLLGPETECLCGKPRTRWIRKAGRVIPACVTCYNREHFNPPKRQILAKAPKAGDVPDSVARRAAAMIRRGATWSFVCQKTGYSQRTLLLWMGRLAAVESF